MVYFGHVYVKKSVKKQQHKKQAQLINDTKKDPLPQTYHQEILIYLFWCKARHRYILKVP